MKKVLVFGLNHFHYLTSFINSLESLGCLTTVCKYSIIDKKKKSKSEREKYYESYRNSLMKQIGGKDIFINFCGNYFYDIIDKNTLELMRKNGIFCVSVYIDSIHRYENINQNLNLYDEVYCFEKKDLSDFSGLNVRLKYLPVGVAESFFNTREESDIKYDVSFVGGLSEEKRLECLDEVAAFCHNTGKKMIVFGGGVWNQSDNFWKKTFKKIKFHLQYKYLSKCYVNRELSVYEINKLFCNTLINMNIHVPGHTGLNPRTFEVLYNENFLLSDYRVDANEEGFIDGENIAFYYSTKDCIDKIKFYLCNPDRRIDIAQKGAILVREKYTETALLKNNLYFLR